MVERPDLHRGARGAVSIVSEDVAQWPPGVSVDAKELWMEPISALAWGLAVATGVGAALGRFRTHAAESVAPVRDLMEHVSIIELQDRLGRESLLGRITFGDSLLGSRLVVSTDDTVVDAVLYRSPDAAAHRIHGSGVLLQSCSFVEDHGWQLVFDTLDGPRRWSAWRITVSHRETASV